MGIQFRRGTDPNTDAMFYKILLYGNSGSGKTWLAASAPNPIVLLTERNGEQSVRISNPRARYRIVSHIQDVRDILAAARNGDLGTPDDPVDTIVCDGLTEIQRLMKDEMLQLKGDGAEMSIAMWGELTEKMRKLLRLLRDLPYHVINTALAESEMEGEVRYVFPAFQGKKLWDEVMQYHNAVAYVYKRQAVGEKRTAEIEHVAVFDAPSKIAAKGNHPLGGTRTGPVSAWIDELKKAIADAATGTPTAKPTTATTTDDPAALVAAAAAVDAGAATTKVADGDPAGDAAAAKPAAGRLPKRGAKSKDEPDPGATPAG